MIDTNVIVSSALNPGSVPFQAYMKAVTYPNHGMICEQNMDEIKRVFNKKLPKKLAALDRFLAMALMTLELVAVPMAEQGLEQKVRDVADRPILRAAIEANVDVLLTGDRDFLESGITDPLIMTPSAFLE